MQYIWHEINNALAELGCADSVSLNSGASPEQNRALEEHIGQILPAFLKELLLVHNGQAGGPGLIYGYELLSTESIQANWDNWRSVEADGMNEECADFMSSNPPGAIKPLYTNAKWIPFAHDYGGNHFGIDFDPAEDGLVGQIIAFGRDEDQKQLKAENIEDFFSTLVSDLRKASWKTNYIEWSAT
jgi:cell wall assembly regulator SMI1